MKRLYLILLLIACGTIATPHFKVKQQPAALIQAQQYTSPTSLPASIVLETFIGRMEITEPVLIELLHHPVLTRIKDIDQHGPLTYFGNYPTFSRYTHSIGVFALLRKFNRPLREQIAGLLHDVSHTVFSHVADHLFKVTNIHKHSYQDEIHTWYLRKMQVDKVLSKYNISVEDINPDLPEFTALEQPRPHLCADRIQYILYTGLIHGKITQEELDTIINSLSFENDTWIIKEQQHARTIAELSLYFAENYWQLPENFAWSHWLCQALKQAIALELITSDDIHFSTDEKILDILNHAADTQIQKAMSSCRKWQDHMAITPHGEPYDIIHQPKVMVVDPLIQPLEDESPFLLTQRDTDYQKSLITAKQRLSKAITLKVTPCIA